MADAEALAVRLDQALKTARSIAPLSEGSAIDLAAAYAVQRAFLARRLGRGEKVTGIKLGFTSAAMRRQMNIASPNRGFLTDAMHLGDGRLDPARVIHPRIEPEVAVRLGKDLSGEAGAAEIAAAVEAVAPAIEVVDTRYHDYRFTLADNTADNSSAAFYVLGPWRAPPPDLDRLPARLLIDGGTVAEASTADVMGGPLNSVAEAARMAAGMGEVLRAGWIILTGGLTPALPLNAGQRAIAVIDGLDQAELVFAASG